MTRTSLKQKLIIRTTITLSLVFIIFMLSFAYYQNLQTLGRIESIRQEHRAHLLEKGSLIVADKNQTLRGHIDGNSIGEVRKILVANVLQDKDIVEAGYIREGDYLTYIWVNDINLDGEIHKTGTLDVKEHLKGFIDDSSGKPVIINDLTRWAMAQSTPQYRTDREEEGFYDFAAPIFVVSEELDEDTGEEVEVKAGVVIYRLSTYRMNNNIQEMTLGSRKDLRNTLLIMGGIALLALGIGFVFTQRQAATITQPLGVLTTAAATISDGKYDVEVKISSGDEIETLGITFNKMAKDLDRTYANLRTRNQQLEEARAELEDLNKHLEQKVEERTKQLAESESKFRTLFEESADAILLGSEDAFFDCNPSMLSMMGCDTKDEFLAMKLDDISPEFQPDDRPSRESLAEYFSMARGAGSRQFEWLNRKKDGTLFFTEIVITSFPLNGKQVLHMVFRDITERKETEEALKIAQAKLVETAHSAGMAEIATGVLHNIGNILNSVNISTEEISGTLKSSKVKGFLKANDLVNKNLDNVSYFFTDHPKGRLIPGYYISLGEAIKEEHQIMTDEIKALSDKVSMMRDVISTQQNYAKATLYTEDIILSDLIEDALKLQLASLRKQGVKIKKDFRAHPRGMISKVKLVHVLTNLIKNGKEAMNVNEKMNKPQELIIRIEEPETNIVEISILDNGCGISEDNIDKIFNHGFTTKRNGHGFGLHTCANFMTEMGGSLTATSEGDMKGACFTLRFPIMQPEIEPGTLGG